MPNPPAYQYYAADFDEDTASWNVEEVGIYQRLLNYSWINGWKPDEGLPNDVKRLCTIARCSHKKFSKGWTIIEKKFSPNGKGYLVNRKLEEIRAKLLKYLESQSESGKRGVEAKREKGIFPFDKSSDPSSTASTDASSDPATQNQALPSSSSKEEKKIYKRKVPLPKDYKLTLQHIEYATSKGVSRSIIEDIFEAFCIHHRKAGSKWTDWFATWQTWIRKRIEFDNKGYALGLCVKCGKEPKYLGDLCSTCHYVKD